VIRANAILSTTDAFYEVYEIKEGDGMYIAPENRISRWH
jgi:predicted metalloendopeptidase